MLADLQMCILRVYCKGLTSQQKSSLYAWYSLSIPGDAGSNVLTELRCDAGLNPLARVFVRVVYGAALSPGSYHGALDEFVVASHIAPHRVIHKVQLGKAHWRLGNREKAIHHLEVRANLCSVSYLRGKNTEDICFLYLRTTDCSRLYTNTMKLTKPASHTPGSNKICEGWLKIWF